jgi:uncharacterized cofD-like protein
MFGVLPPGDVRNCIAAAAPSKSSLADLLQHRFRSGGDLHGHPVGNLLLTALTQVTGDFQVAVEKLGEMVGARATVLPCTRDNVRLTAEMESGLTLVGETAIVGAGGRIRKLSLHPAPRPLPEVLRALVNADGIIVGPGSLYTSILPVLLIPGVAATISGLEAVRIYVANLMTEPGETDEYTLDDHLRVIREQVGADLFDVVLVNRAPVDGAAAARYAAQGSRPVVYGGALKHAGRAVVVECDLTSHHDANKIRHDSAPLAAAIHALVAARQQERPKA